MYDAAYYDQPWTSESVKEGDVFIRAGSLRVAQKVEDYNRLIRVTTTDGLVVIYLKNHLPDVLSLFTEPGATYYGKVPYGPTEVRFYHLHGSTALDAEQTCSQVHLTQQLAFHPDVEWFRIVYSGKCEKCGQRFFADGEAGFFVRNGANDAESIP